MIDERESEATTTGVSYSSLLHFKVTRRERGIPRGRQRIVSEQIRTNFWLEVYETARRVMMPVRDSQLLASDW